MAALMSVADTLPPGSPRSAGGSPPQPPPQRSASRSSQHSPNSSGMYTLKDTQKYVDEFEKFMPSVNHKPVLYFIHTVVQDSLQLNVSVYRVEKKVVANTPFFASCQCRLTVLRVHCVVS